MAEEKNQNAHGSLIALGILFCFPVGIIWLWAAPPKAGFLSTVKSRGILTGILLSPVLLFLLAGLFGPTFFSISSVPEFTADKELKISGKAPEGSTVLVARKKFEIDGSEKFSHTVPLRWGKNKIKVVYTPVEEGAEGEEREIVIERVNEKQLAYRTQLASASRPSKVNAEIECENRVRQGLLSPSSADFDFEAKIWEFESRGPEYVLFRVKNGFEAQNAFGVEIRNNYTCDAEYNLLKKTWSVKVKEIR